MARNLQSSAEVSHYVSVHACEATTKARGRITGQEQTKPSSEFIYPWEEFVFTSVKY